MRHPNRNKDVPADTVKYHAVRKDVEKPYTVQYMYPSDTKCHLGRFLPDWLNKWCKHSRHARLEDAITVFRKMHRDYWMRLRVRCRIVDDEGNVVNVCPTCGDLKHGELCRREFVDFVTGEWVHA